MLTARIHTGDWSLDDTKLVRAFAVRAFALLRVGVSWLRKTVCALRGHDMVLQFEPDRLCLGCLKCGARTSGWTIDVNPAFRRRVRRHDPELTGPQRKAA